MLGAQADRRERRKDIQEHITAIRARAETVLARATDYWLIETGFRRQAAAVAVKAELQALFRLTRSASAAGLRYDTADCLIDIRSAATGGDFEVKGRKRCAADTERLADLVGALEDLVGRIEVSFYEQFQPVSVWRPWRIGLLSPLVLLSRDAPGGGGG